MNHDLKTAAQGGIYREFFKFVSLNIISMFGLSLYILADTFFVANGVGSDGLISLNLVLPAYSFINGIGLLLGIGGAARFAIAKGQGMKERYSKIFMQVVYLAAIIGVAFLFAGIAYSDRIVVLLGATPDIVPYASIYLKTIMCFSPAFLFNNIMICFVRNDGNPHLAMTAMLTASLSNIALDYLFVFPMGMGMFGAAFATGLAPILSLCVLSLHQIKKRNSFHFERCGFLVREIKNIFLVGIPSFITEFSSGVIMLLFNFIILNIAGNLGVGAYGIICNIALVCLAIFTGIAQGIQPVLSVNYGAGRIGNIQKIYHAACALALSLGLLFYGIGTAFDEQIIQLFNKGQNQTLSDIAVGGIRIYFAAFIFAGINIVTSSYFACILKAKHSLLISSFRGFIAVVPLILILPGFLGMNGVWLSVPIAEILTTALILCFAFLPKKAAS